MREGYPLGHGTSKVGDHQARKGCAAAKYPDPGQRRLGHEQKRDGVHKLPRNAVSLNALPTEVAESMGRMPRATNARGNSANNHTVNAGKKTISPADVFKALEELELDFLKGPLEAEFDSE